MAKRKAWHGNPPSSQAEARRRLLDVARGCVERLGARAGLTDVATEAGVTRQTVYRYFDDADDLFRSAAALTTGGFLERLRAHTLAHGTTLPERIVENLVFTIRELPNDPHLGALQPGDELFGLGFLMDLRFVQEEVAHLAGGETGMTPEALDGLAELMLRLLHSFLSEPGKVRTEEELRNVLQAWLLPVISRSLGGTT
jgi:AcrR family transcriptional regulator